MTTSCPKGTIRYAASPDAPGTHASPTESAIDPEARGIVHEGAGATVARPVSISVHLPLPPKECHPNWTGKLRDRIRAKREAREWAYYAAIEAMGHHAGGRQWYAVHWSRVRASAAFTFAVKRTRDDDGLTGSLKNYRDGIATALCGDDSAWTWDGPPTVAIGPHEGVVITVWEVTE
jgi:hypothetical protein